MLFHAGVMVVWSEQLAIRREMGRGVWYNLVGAGADEESGRRKVVFDEAEEGGDRYE